MSCTVCNAETGTGWSGEKLSMCPECTGLHEKILHGQREEIAAKKANQGVADTFKFGTVVFIILGVIIPFWIVTLPLFWFLAYRSYKQGRVADPAVDVAVTARASSALDEIQMLKTLLDAGAITQGEFEAQKRKLLERV